MKSSSNQYHKKVCGKDTTAHLGQKNFKCENENSDFKTGSKPTDNIPHSEPTLATQCPNVKSSDDQESQSIQKPVRYTHVLPKPQKGQWIVVLEKLDASNKDSPFNDTSNLDEPSAEESKSNQIFELDTFIPNNNFEEIVIKEEWDEHEEMDSVIDMKI